MMKLLHSADWHLDAPMVGKDEAQAVFLRAQLRKVPEKVAKLCKHENCSLLLLSGDLFDGEYTKESYRAVYDALKELDVPVFIAPGNHDFCRPGSPYLEEAWPENVHIFTGPLESVVLENLNCRIWGAGFQSMDCSGLLENFRAEGTEAYAIGLLHGDPAQTRSPYNPVTAAQVRESGLDYLALGHIHKSGSFRAGSTLCGWPGCPMGRGWDETGDKGVYLVALQPDSARIRSLSLGLPCFRELSADIAGDAKAALEALLPPVETSDFFRVTLKGQGYADIPQLLSVFPHIPNLELIDRTEAPLDIWGQEDADTLEGIYFRLLKEQLEEASETEARQIRLAAEISRRLMEGREVVLP